MMPDIGAKGAMMLDIGAMVATMLDFGKTGLKNISPKSTSLIIIMTFSLLLTGCWDNRDVTEINLVTAIGVDKTPDERVEIIFEIPRPSLTRTGQGGGGGGSSQEKAVTIVSSEGDTTFIAGRSMAEKLAKGIFSSKMELLLIGEELARGGLKEVLDLMERDPEASMTAQVLLVKGVPVKQVMEAESKQEKIPSLHLVKSITVNQDSYGSSKEARVIDVLREVALPGKDPLIPVVEILEAEDELKVKNMLVSGSAVFRGDKLAGYLTATETRGWLLTENKVKASVYSLPSPNNEEENISFEMYSQTGQKKVEFLDGEPKLLIKIKVAGNIGESQEPADLTQRQMLEKLQAGIEEIIRKEVVSALNTAQEYQSDVFGFGDIIHRKHPQEWRKLQDKWPEIFSKAPTEITVDVKLKKSGYTRKGIAPV
jgi:spore germination protein KC